MSNLNLTASIAWLNAHAHAASQSKCAVNVRLALQAGGVDIPPVAARNFAKNYGPLLLAQNFTEVTGGAPSSPQKGDIVVIQPYPGGNIAGHIAMYNGHQWVSDFRQIDMWGGPGYRSNKPPFKIYRSQGAE
ncbi:hypothetical protein G5S35_23460 [Paraburkholderia tropica]|uniref:hypothetical protein n=1 Tax=Paraburkholderia tropica TaxID=92647 RepID=UPI001600A1D9|nr:hypothetical protein [Paraburkholderia tropica]QNB14636.1 hypothetical protein G5S35_23460 [Paraburkholderia tropica]